MTSDAMPWASMAEAKNAPHSRSGETTRTRGAARGDHGAIAVVARLGVAGSRNRHLDERPPLHLGDDRVDAVPAGVEGHRPGGDGDAVPHDVQRRRPRRCGVDQRRERHRIAGADVAAGFDARHQHLARRHRGQRLEIQRQAPGEEFRHGRSDRPRRFVAVGGDDDAAGAIRREHRRREPDRAFDVDAAAAVAGCRRDHVDPAIRRKARGFVRERRGGSGRASPGRRRDGEHRFGRLAGRQRRGEDGGEDGRERRSAERDDRAPAPRSGRAAPDRGAA